MSTKLTQHSILSLEVDQVLMKQGLLSCTPALRVEGKEAQQEVHGCFLPEPSHMPREPRRFTCRGQDTTLGT